MNTKSNILVQIELREAANRLKEYTEYLFETFTIDDIVLGIVRNQPQEITTGYLVEQKEYPTLNEAIYNLNPTRDCLRVCEGKYYVGRWSQKPENITEGHILNISNFREI